MDDANPDRLYDLLPAIYRMRDADQGYPLQALLRVIAEQVNVVEDDIAQLYDNWFIETAQDWAVPYIGDLVGYPPVHEAGEPGDVSTAGGPRAQQDPDPAPRSGQHHSLPAAQGHAGAARNAGERRGRLAGARRGVLRLLGWTQNINHQQLERGRTVDLRDGDALDLLDGPFDRAGAHRRCAPHQLVRTRPGRYNIPSVGVVRLAVESLPGDADAGLSASKRWAHTATPSACSARYAAVHRSPSRKLSRRTSPKSSNLPAPIRRRPFEQHLERYYGADKSLAIWAGDWADYDPEQPLPVSALIAADLSRLAVHPAARAHRGRSGAGPHRLSAEATAQEGARVVPLRLQRRHRRRRIRPPDRRSRSVCRLYRVGEEEPFKRITQALSRWHEDLKQWPADEPCNAVIEIADSGVYVELINIR